jgi:CRISPR-associated protein Csd1
MSILASLARAYGRLPDAPRFGYSSEKVGLLVSLNADGSVAHVIDLREGDGRRLTARSIMVPQPEKRTVAIAPNFLWDKTAYALGVTVGEGKRTAAEHAAFVQRHAEALANETDEGLRALAAFLRKWTPDQFAAPLWPDDAKDQNVVFCLESERLQNVMLHDRPAAEALWSRVSRSDGKDDRICLVTGKPGPIARLHPSIKGVEDAQSAGAAIVSFNLDAFTSYGHEQGDNAPVSEAATFAYAAALNRFLQRDSGHRLRLGDATTVFWADASADLAGEAEALFTAFADPAKADANAVKEIADKLVQIRAGKDLRTIEPELAGVSFHVLGLAPNIARLSVRFYFENSFGALTENYQAYLRDMAFQPWPEGRKLSIGGTVLRTAPARVDKGKLKFDRAQIPPLLAGELLRSILTGARYPGGLLPLLLLRVRSDHVLDSTRIALIKGLIVRAMRLDGRLPINADGTPKEDYLVRSDPNDPHPARRLGRLFAVIERAQLAALGDEINATVKDKFLGAAAATPQQVFVGILKNAENHTKRLRNGHSDAKWIKDATHARAVGASLERDIGRLWGSFPDGVPKQHSIEDQGLFLVGYYQERYGGKAEDGDAPEAATEPNETNEDGE